MTSKRPIATDDLYRLRLISDARIAPDGTRVAFVLKVPDKEKNDYISNIYLVDRDGAVRQLTNGEKDSAPRWSPDGASLAFLSARKDKPQIHLLSLAGGESVALTDRKLGAGVPVWSPDGEAIVFSAAVSTDPEEEEKDPPAPAIVRTVSRSGYKSDGVGYLGNRRNHLFRIDVAAVWNRLAGRTVEQLTDGDFFDNQPSWSPDGQQIVFVSNRQPRWDVSVGSDVYLIPRTGGEAQQITAGSSFGNPVFSPDGSRIAVTGWVDPDDFFAPPRIYTIGSTGADLRDALGDWDWAVGNSVNSDVALWTFDPGLTWHRHGLYFLGAARGEANVYRITDGGVESATTGLHTITDFSLAGDGTIAFSCADSLHPTEIHRQEGSDARQLTHENDAFLDEVEVACPERFTFAGADGEENDGWLLPPRGSDAGKHPLLVYIHGGPHTAHGEAFFFEYQYLAAQGFGVFYPNIHGSSTYGRAYQTSIWRDWGNKDFQDVIAGTREAMTRPWVDSARMAVLGGSYGGFLTTWVLGHSDLFRAGVSERGLYNWVSFIGTSDIGWVWDRITGAYPEQDIQKLWDMSPLKYVAQIDAPVLVLHSEGDDRTPLEQGEQMFNALRRLGKDVTFVRFPEESHGLTRMGKPVRRVKRMELICDWLKQKL